MQTMDRNKRYRNLFLVESRDWWEGCANLYDASLDLVLTYDFGLLKDIEALGGHAEFLDHLVGRDIMQQNNFLVYQFFREWHLDAHKTDIFEYRGVPFGFSFRIEIWNDLIAYTRTFISIASLSTLKYDRIYAGMQTPWIVEILGILKFDFQPFQSLQNNKKPTYYFPIFRWFEEQLRPGGIKGLKRLLRVLITAVLGEAMPWLDKLLGHKNRKRIYVHEYHPTRDIIRNLKSNPDVTVVHESFTSAPGLGKLLTERVIPIWGRLTKFQADANSLIQQFAEKRVAKLTLSNGIDISAGLYRIFERRIVQHLPKTLRALVCVRKYIEKNPFDLEVLISNIGEINTLVDSIAKPKGTPSYLIINGLLGNEFSDEGKYATVINSYSTSIKNHYFRGMNNVVCLGDPRMDAYVNSQAPRPINRDSPTITIGAAGYNNIDLNSYYAFEFDFMNDVLAALQLVKSSGANLRIIIKVRPNGYRAQYCSFVDEYFPGLVDEILDTVPMRSVLERTDFYISFYSQTLFEASSLGIPCLYYKKDVEIMDPPFDGASELVTVDNVSDLVIAIDDFRAKHSRYESFLEKGVMEKYIGPLDGKNLERNLSFISSLLAHKAEALA